MTQTFEESFPVLNHSWDPKSQKGKQTLHFRSTTHTKTVVVHKNCDVQSIVHIRRSVCVSVFDQHNQNKEARRNSLSWEIITHHRRLLLQGTERMTTNTAKKLRNYQNKQVLSAEDDKSQYFQTLFVEKKNRKMDTSMQRRHTTSQQSKCKIGVQSWIRRQRSGQDCIPLKSWCHQIRIYIFSHGYSSAAKVSTNILLRYSTWSNLLRKKQSAFLPVKKILPVWRNLARTTDPYSPTVKLTAKGNPARIILPKWNHHVITASKSSLKNQLSQWKLHLREEAHQSFQSEKLWVPAQTSRKYNHNLTPILKTTQKILRYEPCVREPDVAVCWPKNGATNVWSAS